MQVIMGLGNPGKKYVNTRHNIGFKVIKELAEKYECSPERKYSGLIAECKIAGKNLMLVQPLTFMNRSGKTAEKLRQKFDLEPQDFLVVHDDLDLELGRIKLKKSGSSGGHNGVKSLISAFSSRDFSRLRMGIGRPPAGLSASDYVLTTFAREEREEVVKPAIKRAISAIELWSEKGCQIAMNEFN